jgi:hypothetical protein
MAVNMHLEGVPDEVYEELQRRAESASTSLEQYTLQVLSAHCAAPSSHTWADRLLLVRARWCAKGDAPSIDAAALVNESRMADSIRLRPV